MVKGGMHGKGGYAWQREVCLAKGACVAGGHVWQGACITGGCACQGACMAGDMATVADGMHPTGMNSCKK